MRETSRRARSLLALPLLLLLQAQHEGPEDCSYWAASYVLIDPLYFPPTEAAEGPVRIVPEAVLAHEVAQVAPHGWMLGAELALPPPDRLLYPAGTPLDPDHSDRRLYQCLPGASAVEPESSARSVRFGSVVRIPCLTDADEDGAYESISVFETKPWMHAPRRELATIIPLPDPVRLVDDPQGQKWHRRHIHRRIRVSDVQEGFVQLIVEHAFHDQRPGSEEPDAAAPDGMRTYRLERPGLEPSEPIRPPLNYQRGSEGSPFFELADRAIVQFGGRRFRVAGSGADWTLEPLDARFPPWVSLQCGGRRIVLGAPKPPL